MRITIPVLRMKIFFGGRPDAEDMEEAIRKFLDGLEEHECRGFDQLHRLLGDLPMPVQMIDSCMTHTTAFGGGFIPEMDEEEQELFTPFELLMHAVEYR